MPDKKILIIGPFPPIINGVTVSNDFLMHSLILQGKKMSKINTETGSIASKQGDKISLMKIISFLTVYVHIYKIIGKNKVYMTRQTFWGFAKYAPFVMVCRMLGIPYFIHIHGGYLCKSYLNLRGTKKKVFDKMINGSRGLIALSEGLSEEMKQTFSDVDIYVIENFYDIKLIEEPLNKKQDKKIRFLFLSNLMLGKGILDFLDALIILQNTTDIDFEIAIAGNTEKGMSKIINNKLISLKGKIVFFGMADFAKKKELLYWSNIFVLPTWYAMEGQPLSIIEAYVTGNIVVSTWQGGIKDISDYDTFFRTKQRNAEDLSNVLIHVVNELKQLIPKTIDTAKKTQIRFAPELFISKIQAILAS